MMANKRAFILVLGMGLGLVPSSTSGGANPMLVEPAPRAHHFLDAKNICLHSLGIFAMSADVASTHRALQVPGAHEANPLARSQGALISLKVAGAGAGLGMAYMLHRTGHYKAERLIPMVFALPSGFAAAHNSGIHR